MDTLRNASKFLFASWVGVAVFWIIVVCRILLARKKVLIAAGKCLAASPLQYFQVFQGEEERVVALARVEMQRRLEGSLLRSAFAVSSVASWLFDPDASLELILVF